MVGQAKVIYSGGEDVDILAAGASKGKGLEFLLRQVRGTARCPPLLRPSPVKASCSSNEQRPIENPDTDGS